MPNQDNAKRVAKNTLFLFIRMVLVLCVGLYTSRIVLSTLGVDDFGIYNVVGSVVILFSFLQQALTNATYRFFAYELGKNDFDKLRKTFSMSVNVHLILSGLIFLLCEFIGVWILNEKLNIPDGRKFAANIVFQFSILSFCVSVVQTPLNSAIIAHERMNFYAYTSIVEVILKLLVVIFLQMFSADKLIMYGLLLFGVSSSIFLWYFFQCRRMFQECKYQPGWHSGYFKDMIKYSGWSIVVNAVDVSVNQSLLFMFNIFFGVVSNAAMGVANQINAQLTNFLNAFTQSYNPQIIKSYAAGDRNYFLKLLFSSSKFSFYLLFFAAVPIMINMDFILRLWLKNPPEGTATFAVLVIMYSLIDAYSAPLWTGVHATGKLRTHQLLMSSIKILNIPLAYLLLKFGMPAWSALALKAALNAICSIVRPCYVRTLYGLPLARYFIDVWFVVYFVAALSLPLPVYISTRCNSDLQKLLLSSSLFYLIYFPVVVFVGMSKKERNLVSNLILKKFTTAGKKNSLIG